MSVSPESEAWQIFSASAAELPNVAPANTTRQWMPHAKFDHGAHEGFTCVSCHAKVLKSTEASDILLPGIETCKKCHAPGPEHAESRCFECHTYHDWSKRKEVTPKFTLPAPSAPATADGSTGFSCAFKPTSISAHHANNH